ncbi:MAG: hypothetical protein K5745_04005 [Saccharofermentans sp.]|nr:hypothetical protein [Saccharofermentans sp.]
MRYGESTFDILYLLFAVITGIVILVRRKEKTDTIMGLAALTLGVGDSFHLVPRVLNYFIDYDFTFSLGLGKLVTSITMTAFYVLMFHLYRHVYGKDDQATSNVGISITGLAFLRVILCIHPKNLWFTGGSGMLWAFLRNAPFIVIGAITVVIYLRVRREDKFFARMWLYIALSFIFYIPVALFASVLPILGMLMLPKTICYVLMLVCFLRKQNSMLQAS